MKAIHQRPPSLFLFALLSIGACSVNKRGITRNSGIDRDAGYTEAIEPPPMEILTLIVAPLASASDRSNVARPRFSINNSLIPSDLELQVVFDEDPQYLSIQDSFSNVTSSNALSNGSHTIYFRFINDAGEYSATTSLDFVIDTIAPQLISLSVDAGELKTASLNVGLALSATGADRMYVTNTQDCSDGGIWQSYSTTRSWNLLQLNQSNAIAVKFLDAAGNESSCIAEYILHDSTAPSDPSNMLWSVASPSATTSLLATWTHSESSDLSEQFVQFYAGSNCDSAVGGEVEVSLTTEELLFSGNNLGTYSYRIRSIDDVGNEDWSGCSSAISVLLPPQGLSYASASVIYVYNDVNSSLTANITPNSPSLSSGTASSYSINPDLSANTGLDFNTTSGIISGKPTLSSATTQYTVTASNANGFTTIPISIRSAPGFLVNSNADASDASTADNSCETAGGVCTLRAALVQRNAWSAANRVILVPAMTITTASTLSISKPTELIGSGESTTVIDANAGSFRILSISGADPVRVSLMTLQNSNGGGVSIASSNAYLEDMTIQNNSAAGDGGGVYGANPSTFQLDRVKVLNNYSSDRGGGINCYVNSTCTIQDSSIIGNEAAGGGGGIRAFYSVTIRGSYIAENSSDSSSGGGLGIHSGSILVVVENSTFYKNFARQVGAISSPITVSLTNSTIAHNGNSYYSGGYGAVSASINAVNTIFSNNLSGLGAVNNCTGHISSSGYNLADSAEADCNLVGAGDLPDTLALLSEAQDNGGPSLTMSPTSGSLAIDGGTEVGVPTVDQRGEPRPHGAFHDIGAFEGSASGLPIDTQAPENATNLSWVESSPSPSTNVNLSWTPSVASDLEKQGLQFFNAANCAAIGTSLVYVTAGESTYNYTGISGSTYSYKVFSFDAHGNFSVSPCSANLSLD